MSTWNQSDAIATFRSELDDPTNGKRVVLWEPDVGDQDGINTTFQIPQTRISVPSFIAYKNRKPLINLTDYTLDDPVGGQITYVSFVPKEEDDLAFTFYWNWFTDQEIDHFGISAAQECKLSAYYTTQNVANTENISQLPTDIPDPLRAAIKYLAISKAAGALSSRFSLKYDISSGDHSFSPSTMAQRYKDLCDDWNKAGLNARDDFYKGQGTQYRPSIAATGFFLPNVTPPR
jgi:hypothetical protein